MGNLMYVIIAVLGSISTYGGGDGLSWLVLIAFMYIYGEIEYIESLMGK